MPRTRNLSASWRQSRSAIHRGISHACQRVRARGLVAVRSLFVRSRLPPTLSRSMRPRARETRGRLWEWRPYGNRKVLALPDRGWARASQNRPTRGVVGRLVKIMSANYKCGTNLDQCGDPNAASLAGAFLTRRLAAQRNVFSPSTFNTQRQHLSDRFGLGTAWRLPWTAPRFLSSSSSFLFSVAAFMADVVGSRFLSVSEGWAGAGNCGVNVLWLMRPDRTVAHGITWCAMTRN